MIVPTAETMRAEFAAETDPATFLNSVLTATGVTLSAGEKARVILTMTREQILAKFVAQANR